MQSKKSFIDKKLKLENKLGVWLKKDLDNLYIYLWKYNFLKELYMKFESNSVRYESLSFGSDSIMIIISEVFYNNDNIQNNSPSIKNNDDNNYYTKLKILETFFFENNMLIANADRYYPYVRLQIMPWHCDFQMIWQNVTFFDVYIPKFTFSIHQNSADFSYSFIKYNIKNIFFATVKQVKNIAINVYHKIFKYIYQFFLQKPKIILLI
jgi:hypothetical protein